jgi:hypothetical protein
MRLAPNLGGNDFRAVPHSGKWNGKKFVSQFWRKRKEVVKPPLQKLFFQIEKIIIRSLELIFHKNISKLPSLFG